MHKKLSFWRNSGSKSNAYGVTSGTSLTYAVYDFITPLTAFLFLHVGHGSRSRDTAVLLVSLFLFYPSHSRAVFLFIYFVACSDGDAHASQSAPTETAAMV